MEEIVAELRQPGGKRSNRRLRAAGKLPAVLYGHKQETVCLLLPSDAVANAVRHGIRVVRLTGAVQQNAFIKELQRDTWGKYILHVDLTRVSAHERVQAQVALELRGEAPGIKEGGVVVQHLHSLEIECDVDRLPEVVHVGIGSLGLNQQLTVADLKLPEGATTQLDPSMVVVECRVAVEEEEPTAEGTTSTEVEPEVIRRKKEEEESVE
ncbi:50S ribosomal protein L25 [Thermopirellula anaerolimosa]